MIGRFLVKIASATIKLYRWLISPLLGNNCRFHPTCSCYALQAFERHGFLKGLYLTIGRVGKCHPWCTRQGHDPVPLNFEFKWFTWADKFGYKRLDKKSKE
jgi:hypothetical protein